VRLPKRWKAKAMRSLHLSTSGLEVGLRWTARLLAAALVGLVVVTFVGVGGFNPLRLSPVGAIQMTLLWTTCAGLIVAWRWPFLGGAIATGGILLFFAVEFAVTGYFPRGLVFYLMLLPGVFFLFSAAIGRRRSAGV
jgi:hypothetical protein